MSAAAVARPKPPQQEALDLAAGLLPHEHRWNQYFAERGFVRAPHALFSRLPVGLSAIEMSIVGLVLQRTVGSPVTRAKPNRPEYAAVTIPEMARLADASENGVSNALGRLVKWGVIAARRCEKNARANEYTPRIEAWETIDVRAMRKERAAQEQQQDGDDVDAAGADGEADDAATSRPAFGQAKRCKPGAIAKITFREPAKAVEIVNETGLPVKLSVAESEGAIAVKIEADSPSGLGESVPAAKSANTPSGLGESKVTRIDSTAVSESFRTWEAALNEAAAATIGQPLPRPLALAQWKRMEALQIPVEMFWQRLDKRRRAFREWGFLTLIVDDVVGAAAIDRSRARAPMPSPTDFAAAAGEQEPF